MAPDAPIEAPIPVPLGARCASHPDAPAVATCTRCGAFLCGACTELRGEGAWCAACVEFLKRETPPSRAVKVFIGLGILGIVTWPMFLFIPVPNGLFAVLGLWISLRELGRIRRGEASPRGRTQARVALGLACANALPVLLLLALVAYSLLGSP